MEHIDQLPTPSLLVLEDRLDENLRSMQSACDDAGIELRPHIKTHKLLPIARRQIAGGALGLTCAKLGEAEAILASGVRELFLAHSLVDPQQASRIAALDEHLDDFRLAVTSEAHLEALIALVKRVGRTLPVMMAIDTGLNREGARDSAAAQRIAAQLARESCLELAGFYTHEGQFYSRPPEEQAAGVADLLERICGIRDMIDPTLPVWPGCSMTARLIAETADGRVQAVRPGAYVFGDLSFINTGVMGFHQAALHVIATVIDKPTADLALIDAGSKTFSSDRTPSGVSARTADGRDLSIVKVNEEHGYLRGADVVQVRVGERIRFVPAHVCPVLNLADEVQVITKEGAIRETWPVDGRGKTQ